MLQVAYAQSTKPGPLEYHHSSRWPKELGIAGNLEIYSLWLLAATLQKLLVSAGPIITIMSACERWAIKKTGANQSGAGTGTDPNKNTLL